MYIYIWQCAFNVVTTGRLLSPVVRGAHHFYFRDHLAPLGAWSLLIMLPSGLARHRHRERFPLEKKVRRRRFVTFLKDRRCRA